MNRLGWWLREIAIAWACLVGGGIFFALFFAKISTFLSLDFYENIFSALAPSICVYWLAGFMVKKKEPPQVRGWVEIKLERDDQK